MNARVVLSFVAALLVALHLPLPACSSSSNSPALRRLETQQLPVVDACDNDCPLTDKPVCGTNGVSAATYRNKCIFRVAKCKSGGVLKLVAKKACPSDRAFCGGGFCAKTQSCVVQSDGISRPLSYCADLCEPANCSENELCVARQVACFNPPCPQLQSCVPQPTS